jgi:hypothetical protein
MKKTGTFNFDVYIINTYIEIKGPKQNLEEHQAAQ